MEYPSFNNNRVYSVPDTRFMKYGYSLERPAAVPQPGCPITPVNMLPYQVATTGVPYGYTLVPTQQMFAPPPVMGQRMMPVPGGRNMYSMVDVDDEDDEYVPPPPRPRSRVLDEIESPEMEEFSAATRQIRKDANNILQRLTTTRPVSRVSDFFRTYDYDTRSLTPKYLAPPPDRSGYRPTSPSLDDEPDPVLQSLRPGGRRSVGNTGSRPLLYSTSSLSGGSDRIYTPTSITANRIQSLYKDLEEPLYAPKIESFDYTECLNRRDRDSAIDKAKVRGDVTRRAVLMEPSLGLSEAREKRSSIKRERMGYDPTSVKSNISIRAQYAAMRLAAGGGGSSTSAATTARRPISVVDPPRTTEPTPRPSNLDSAATSNGTATAESAS